MHGCGGGGSSGLRKTCWPRLRNWTTAMRMWCSTRTILAAARPPARRPGRCARSARPQQLRRVRTSVRPSPAPARPLPAPRPPQPRLPARNPGQHLSASAIFGPPHTPAPAPRAPYQLSLPSSLRSQDYSSFSAIRIPRQGAGSQPSLPSLAPSPLLSLPRRGPRRAPILSDHILSPPLRKSWSQPRQSPKAETSAVKRGSGVGGGMGGRSR